MKKTNTSTKSAYVSLDEKHKECCQSFQDLETVTLPQWEEKKQNILAGMASETLLEKRLDLKDELMKINENIRQMKRKKKDYYLENASSIFTYFEEKKKINLGENKKNDAALNAFFKIKTASTETTACSFKESKRLYQKYWNNMNKDTVELQEIQTETCPYCQIGEMILQEEEGILICSIPTCGRFIPYLVETNKTNNKEPPNEVSYTAYIRLNHFKEILSQFQAKETTQIPEEVMESIRNRIKKERIVDISTITYTKMRDILRKLGLNKYFEHIQYINSLFGIKPPHMSEELHETLCVLFIEIQKPWAMHCPPNRTNFFNYTYTLYQLCVLLGQTQYLPHIPLLKDRIKSIEQDMIWKEVCNDLDWEFIPII
jgi:hypothetical protein